MKIRTILGLGLIGTAIYAHKQHGGDLSFDSIKKSAIDLGKTIQNMANRAKKDAENLADKAQAQVKDLANKANHSDAATGFGTGGYKPGGTGTRH